MADYADRYAALVGRMERLADQWDRDCATYPLDSPEGRGAYAGVKVCGQELRDAVAEIHRPDLPTGAGERPVGSQAGAVVSGDDGPGPATSAARAAEPDGEDDVEVWVPPISDCMDTRHDPPCPHCGSQTFHVRTGRCGSCGRRPVVAQS